MSKTKKSKQQTVPQKTDPAVHCANIYRYFFLPVLVIVALFWRGQTLLVMGTGFIAFALYTFIGYKCQWKHIYLAFQEMQRSKMTPNHIQWNTIKTGTVLKFPILFGITGIVMVVYQLFYA